MSGVIGITFLGAVLAFALWKPGFAAAVALFLGRQILTIGPLHIYAAITVVIAIGIRLGAELSISTRVRVNPKVWLMGATLAIVSGVGYVRIGDVGINGLNAYGQQKAYLILAVEVPLVLMVGWLSTDPKWRGQLFVGLVAIPLGLAIISGAGTHTGRAVALDGGPITLAQFCLIAALILLFAWNSELRPIMRKYPGATVGRWLVLAFLVVVAFRTESRFPLIAFAFCVLFGILHRSRRSQGYSIGKRARTLLLVGMILVGLSAGINSLGSHSRYTLFLQDPSAEISRSRLPAWTVGLSEAREGGVLGLGFGAFPSSASGSTAADLQYAHNLELELLGEGGWFAGGLCIVVYFGLLMEVLRRRYTSIASLTLFAFLVVQVSGDLYNSRLFFILLALGLCSHTTAATKRQTDEGRFLEEVEMRPRVGQSLSGSPP